MNDQALNILLLQLPFWIMALEVLLPIAIIWGIVLLIKRIRRDK